MHPVVETARSLVSIPSVNPDRDPDGRAEAGVAEWLVCWAKKHGIPAEVEEILPGRPNVTLTLRNEADHPRLLLAAHSDTVGVKDMTIPPWEGYIDDGRLWGRGSADMKGPFAAMLEALLEMHRDRQSWRGSVVLACVVDEEFRARGIKAFLRNDKAFDFAIVGEPTRMQVVRGCKGCLRFSFSALGRAAHSSTPFLGSNAILAMSEALLALNGYLTEVFALRQLPDFGSGTGSISLIRGGAEFSIVPEICHASVDVRLLPGQDWSVIYEEIRETIRKSASVVRDVAWTFDETPFTDPPYAISENSKLVREALAALALSQAEVVAFSCDASKIAGAGIPCIILGPGDIAQAHTANESIGLDELEAGVDAYKAVMRRLLNSGCIQ